MVVARWPRQMQNCGDIVFRNTASKKGRNLSLTPRTSVMKRLHYGRILLDSELPRAGFETDRREVGLICLSGDCEGRPRGQTYALGQSDAGYLPRTPPVNAPTSTQHTLAHVTT